MFAARSKGSALLAHARTRLAQRQEIKPNASRSLGECCRGADRRRQQGDPAGIGSARAPASAAWLEIVAGADREGERQQIAELRQLAADQIVEALEAPARQGRARRLQTAEHRRHRPLDKAPGPRAP